MALAAKTHNSSSRWLTGDVASLWPKGGRGISIAAAAGEHRREYRPVATITRSSCRRRTRRPQHLIGIVERLAEDA